MTTGNQGIFINTISGGIVNFGGAIKIAPISITTSSTGSGQSNKATDVTENSDKLLQNLNSIIPAQNKNLRRTSER